MRNYVNSSGSFWQLFFPQTELGTDQDEEDAGQAGTTSGATALRRRASHSSNQLIHTVCFYCVAEDLTHSKYSKLWSPMRISHVVSIQNYTADQCRMAITGYMCQIKTLNPQSVCEITHRTLTGMFFVCNYLCKRTVSPWKDSLSPNRNNSQPFQL